MNRFVCPTTQPRASERATSKRKVGPQAAVRLVDHASGCLHPIPRICGPTRSLVWPVEGDRYGIDLSYAGATGYTRADQAHQTFRQELGDMWTVRLGPLARDAMVLVVERYA